MWVVVQCSAGPGSGGPGGALPNWLPVLTPRDLSRAARSVAFIGARYLQSRHVRGLRIGCGDLVKASNSSSTYIAVDTTAPSAGTTVSSSTLLPLPAILICVLIAGDCSGADRMRDSNCKFSPRARRGRQGTVNAPCRCATMKQVEWLQPIAKAPSSGLMHTAHADQLTPLRTHAVACPWLPSQVSSCRPAQHSCFHPLFQAMSRCVVDCQSYGQAAKLVWWCQLVP